MNTVVLDGYSLNPGDLNWASIEKFGKLTVYDRTDVADIVDRCKDTQMVLTNKVPFTRQTMEHLPNLRFIGVLATGYNIIDTVAAKEMGIVVCNIPAYSTASVAQSTFALLLAITNRSEHYTRQIVDENRWCNNPDFCYWDTKLTELENKRFGIVGMGRIGSRVAVMAQALGMEVVTISSKPQSELPHGVKKVNSETFWATCDVVSLHCPLTDATKSLVNEETLKQMKDGAVILNTSRGPVVDEKAVAVALASGRLGAFGADVLSSEPPSPNNPILQSPNVFLTPHIAWATVEARTRLMLILEQNIKAFLDGNPINVVNL